MRPSVDTYTRTQQALHWIGALLIFAMFPMGFVMARTEDEALRTMLYRGHAVMGVVIVGVVVARIVLAWHRRTSPPPGLPRWNEFLHVSVHRLSLLAPIVLALSGLATMIMNDLLPDLFLAGESVPGTLENERAQSAHQLIAWIYLGLLATHVIGVMRYQFTKGDVMRRMGVQRFPSRALDG